MTQDALIVSTKDIDLDVVFAEMGEGWKISVKRVEPFWADGFIGTFEHDPDQPISMDWIRNMFGGRKLQVKVLDHENKYVAHRTLKFPDAPRENGEELIQGPDGTAIKKYAAGQTAPAPRAVPEPQPQPAPQSPDLVVSLMQKMIDSQAQASSTLQTLLFSRIQHLEGLLTQNAAQQQPAPVAAAPPQNPLDPLAQMQNTLQVVEQLEAFRQAITPAEQTEPSIYEKMMEKFVDLELSKKKRELEQHSAAAQAPPLPTAAAPQPAPSLSDAQLAEIVRQRLDGMDPQQKADLLGHVLGEELDIEEYEENDYRHESSDALDSNAELLTIEDREALGDDTRHTDSGSGEDARPPNL